MDELLDSLENSGIYWIKTLAPAFWFRIETDMMAYHNDAQLVHQTKRLKSIKAKVQLMEKKDYDKRRKPKRPRTE